MSTPIKVASTTWITSETAFHYWLDQLPFHTPNIRRIELWEEAQGSKVGVWSQERKGQEFFFWE